MRFKRVSVFRGHSGEPGDLDRMEPDRPGGIDANRSANRASEPREPAGAAIQRERIVELSAGVETARAVAAAEAVAAGVAGRGWTSHERGPLLTCPASMEEVAGPDGKGVDHRQPALNTLTVMPFSLEQMFVSVNTGLG